MHIILFDQADVRIQLRPLTFFRPIAELRVGILTLKEKWQKLTSYPVSTFSEPYLIPKFPTALSDDNLLVCSSVVPDKALVQSLMELPVNEGIFSIGEKLLATRLDHDRAKKFLKEGTWGFLKHSYNGKVEWVEHLYDLIRLNQSEILSDFKLLTQGEKSKPVQDQNQVLGTNLFVHPSASIAACTIDSREGPVYIGPHAQVMPGACLGGNIAIGEHATVKMGALLYAGSSVGPYCKAAGEISNSILQGYCSKAHDGYLGDSFLSEWCNLGAGTTVSNLKNNYAKVRQWDYSSNSYADSGMQFLGLVLGDHSKTGIGTLFNTGTVAGVCSNIFGSGFQKNFIPSFVVGGNGQYKPMSVKDFTSTASIVFGRRGRTLANEDEDIINQVYALCEGNKYQ